MAAGTDNHEAQNAADKGDANSGTKYLESHKSSAEVQDYVKDLKGSHSPDECRQVMDSIYNNVSRDSSKDSSLKNLLPSIALSDDLIASKKNNEEKKGDTTVKKDEKGDVKEYENGNYSLSKHDDGSWYYHENGDGHDYVKVDGNSIKMDDKGKVTYNETGMFGKEQQTLGNGSTGFMDSVTHAAKTSVENSALAMEGISEGTVNGVSHEINNLSRQAHDSIGLPEVHISDLKLPYQEQLDNSLGGKIGKFMGELPSEITTAVTNAAIDLGKTVYNFDKMIAQDGMTILKDSMNDPSKLGKDFSNMGGQAVDFGKGVAEGFAIKPINSMIGLADSGLNYASGTHEFNNRFKIGDLVTDEYAKNHVAAKVGVLVGEVAFAVATSEIGGEALVALRGGTEAAEAVAASAEAATAATTTEAVTNATTEAVANATTEAATEAGPNMLQRIAGNKIVREAAKDSVKAFVAGPANDPDDSVLKRLENAGLMAGMGSLGEIAKVPDTRVDALDQVLDSTFDKALKDPAKQNAKGTPSWFHKN